MCNFVSRSCTPWNINTTHACALLQVRAKFCGALNFAQHRYAMKGEEFLLDGLKPALYFTVFVLF